MKNGYLLICPETSQALYVDPGDEAPQLLGLIKQQGLQLTGIAATHGHLDHICGITKVKEQWDVPILLNQEDERLYRALPQQGEMFGFHYAPAPPVDRYLSDGENLVVGNLSVKVRFTPGHSPGSVCFSVDSHLFCGDVIFAGAIGRTDLPGGSSKTLLQSIRDRVLPLGDDQILHPGHGPDTTIGQERRSNPFLTDIS